MDSLISPTSEEEEKKDNSRFSSHQDRHDSAKNLIDEDCDYDSDRVKINDLFSGVEIPVDEGTPAPDLINRGIGYDAVQPGIDILSSAVTRKTIWSIDVEGGDWTPEEKAKAQEGIAESFNTSVKKTGTFKTRFSDAATHLILHARSPMLFLKDDEFFPESCDLKVPEGTGTRPDDFTWGVVAGNIYLQDLERHKDKESSKWNSDAINEYLKLTKLSHTAGSGSSQTNRKTVNERADRDRRGDAMREDTTKVPVYYIFEADWSKECPTVSCTITPRGCFPYVTGGNSMKKPHADLYALYHNPVYYKNLKKFYHPFFLGSNLSEKTTYHDARGIGKMIYDSVIEQEQLTSDIVRSSREGLWNEIIADDDNTEDLHRYKHTRGVLRPSTVQYAEQLKNPNLSTAITTLQLLGRLDDEQSHQELTNSGSRVNQLKSQSEAFISRNNKVIKAKSDSLKQPFNRLGEEILRRYIFGSVKSNTEDAKEVKAWRAKMKEMDIDIEKFGELDDDGNFKYLRLQPIAIDAVHDAAAAQAANSQTLQFMQFLPERTQRLLIKRMLSQIWNSEEEASEMIPIEDTVHKASQQKVSIESYQMRIMAALPDFILPIEDGDIDEEEAPLHMDHLEGLLASGQANNGWSVTDFEHFKKEGVHTMSHIQRYPGRTGKDAAFGQMMQRFQGIVEAAAPLIAQLQQEQQQEEQPSQMEQLKAQLMLKDDQRKDDDSEIKKLRLQLDAQKQEDLVQDRERSDARKEQADAHNQFLDTRKAIKEETQTP